VGGAGVPPYQQVTYQAEAQMRRDGFSEAEIAEAVAYMNQKWDVARTGGEGWDRLQAATQNARDKKWLARVQPATKLEDIVPSWKLQMGYNPLPALERVKCPILAVFGELDTLTPIMPTMANYRKAADKAGNRDYTLKVFPNADHSLLVWPKPDDPAHWPVLAAGYLETMRTWINKRVGLAKSFRSKVVQTGELPSRSRRSFRKRQGVEILESHTASKCFGVFPYADDIHLDPEDSLALLSWQIRTDAFSSKGERDCLFGYSIHAHRLSCDSV
jgi:hypothetical protein